MILHVYVSRNAALEARKSRHGSLTVEVGDEWLATLDEAEVELLKHFGMDEKRPIGRSAYSSGDRYYHDREILLAEPTPDAVSVWLTATVEAVAAYRVKKEQQEVEKKAERLDRWRQKATEALEGGPEGMIRSVYAESYSLCDWLTVYGLDEKDVREHEPDLAAAVDVLYEEAEKLAKARMEHRAAEVAAEKARKAAAKAQHDQERLDWIAKHGSKHLQELVEHNFPFAETYRTERRTMELGGGWVNYAHICGEVKDIRDPSEDALAVWKEMRERYADKSFSTFKAEDIKLQWLGDGQHGDCGDEPDDYSCPLCGDTIEQRPVLTLEYMDTLYVHEIE